MKKNIKILVMLQLTFVSISVHARRGRQQQPLNQRANNLLVVIVPRPGTPIAQIAHHHPQNPPAIQPRERAMVANLRGLQPLVFNDDVVVRRIPNVRRRLFLGDAIDQANPSEQTNPEGQNNSRA